MTAATGVPEGAMGTPRQWPLYLLNERAVAHARKLIDAPVRPESDCGGVQPSADDGERPTWPPTPGSDYAEGHLGLTGRRMTRTQGQPATGSSTATSAGSMRMGLIARQGTAPPSGGTRRSSSPPTSSSSAWTPPGPDDLTAMRAVASDGQCPSRRRGRSAGPGEQYRQRERARTQKSQVAGSRETETTSTTSPLRENVKQALEHGHLAPDA